MGELPVELNGYWLTYGQSDGLPGWLLIHNSADITGAGADTEVAERKRFIIGEAMQVDPIKSTFIAPRTLRFQPT
jgi:hypothetical protein